MMNRRLSENQIATIIEAVLILAVFAVLFLTMRQSPPVYTIMVNFCITTLFFLYMAYRSYRHIKRAVRHMTDEISKLPQDLSEKNYDVFNDETKIFYDELTRVKKLLDKRNQNRQELLDIVNTVASNIEFNGLLRELLPRLNEATRSSCSAFYVLNASTNKLEIKHSVGFSKNIYSEFDLTLGEGMIGGAAANKEITLFRDIPEDTVYYIRTFLGKIKPRSLMVVPINSQNQLTGLLVCASIYEYTREDKEMIELVKYYMGVAVSNGENYEKTKRLTNELTFQNKLIQDQHEEMKKRLNDKTQLLNNMVNYLAGECLYVLDTHGMVLIWNHGAERLFEINKQAALGKQIDRLMEEHHWPAATKQMQAALKNDSYTECFWKTSPEDASRRFELTMTRMRDEQNETIGVLSLIKEIAAE